MGQNLDNINIIKDTLFSQSKESINSSFDFHIIDTIDIKSKKYIGLIIALDNYKFNQFIVNKNDIITNIKDIKVKLSDIKLKMINNKNYLEIKGYSVVNKKLEFNKNDLKLYIFDLPEIVENLNTIELKSIFSIKLKAQETDLISSYEYKFSDNYSNNILINLPNELLNFIESDKVYLFNGFSYSSNNKTLMPINSSSIEILDENSEIEKIIFRNIQTIIDGETININFST